MRSRKQKSSGPFVLGIDFGTLSARALIVNAETGEEVASAACDYPHGSIEERLPGSKRPLPPDFALQHPADWMHALFNIVPKAVKMSGVRPEQVVGIGTDFTSCTPLPTTRDGFPLCLDDRWSKDPHAWPKLWKHHAAQAQADRINQAGQERSEAFIPAYGGRYSSEWMFSKVLETLENAPRVYAAADRFIEGGDWIVWQLTGNETRNLSAAGFKAMWVYPDGHGGWRYPDKAFFRALHPGLENVVEEKLGPTPVALGTSAGGLLPGMAERLGLCAGIPVAVGNIDAHVAVPACGVTRPGEMVMILGTSACHLLVGNQQQLVKGMCGVVQNGVVNGAWGYEAGQASVGDLFAWYVRNGVPAWLQSSAKVARSSPYELLEKQAAELKPGQTGLLALDWWNGCRSVLMNSELSGLLLGVTLATKPQEIYRALMESTAFGTRRILEAFTSQGVEIRRLAGCGGLAKKNPLLMQIYSDVLGLPIQAASSDQACALGAAMHGALAAGIFPNMQAAASAMARMEPGSWKPHKPSKATYDKLYAEYLRLHDHFGAGESGVMKTLRQLRAQSL
ncbi:MAG: ribulokinase [Verrucomicrobia bacterium]|nr:ribulokinase [Verrucomicrobiota bacterium]